MLAAGIKQGFQDRVSALCPHLSTTQIHMPKQERTAEKALGFSKAGPGKAWSERREAEEEGAREQEGTLRT